MEADALRWSAYLMVYSVLSAAMFLIAPAIAASSFGPDALVATYVVISALFWIVLIGTIIRNRWRESFLYYFGRFGEFLLMNLIALITGFSLLGAIELTGIADVSTAGGFVMFMALGVSALALIQLVAWLNSAITRFL